MIDLDHQIKERGFMRCIVRGGEVWKHFAVLDKNTII